MRSYLLRMTASAALAVGMSLASGAAFAQTANADFEKGVKAFDQGKYADAIALWEPLAEDGNVEALRNLAQLHRLGLGVQQSDTKAFELYEKAAERGLAAAQVNAAFLLLTGKGVEQDRAAAATWFAKASDQGNALAQYNLGLMYEKGIGVDQSDELALELYQAAAGQGQKRAIARLEAMEDTIAETAEEGPAAKGLAAIIKSEGQSKTPRPSDAERANVADAFKAQGKTMTRPAKSGIAAEIAAEGKSMAKAPRPDKTEMAEAVKAAGETVAANADLSITPSEKPLEFETLEAPEKTGLPTYKPEAQNGVNTTEVIETIVIEDVAAANAAQEDSAAKSGDLVITPAPTSKPVAASAAVEDAKAAEQAAALPRLPVSAAPTSSNAVAQVRMAENAYRNGDFSKAVEMLAPLSESGMPIAQFWLGRLYNRGEGVPLDRTAAYALWRSAAASGSSNAATALANLSGRLSPEEIARAEQIYASMIQ